MKTIEYQVTFNEGTPGRVSRFSAGAREVVTVRARDINSGFAKAIKQAKEPLGNGTVREIVSIEFWEVK